jgi:hypothetical protein
MNHTTCFDPSDHPQVCMNKNGLEYEIYAKLYNENRPIFNVELKVVYF